MQNYKPKEIEPKWQKIWQENKIYEAEDASSKPKKYILEYFPYPSGAAMHVGHVRNYTIGDVMARYYRMQGFNVLHPMGWDAFGLPAENYAIKNNISPQKAIAENTSKFKQQLMQMGFSYDWSREINSSDPSYYKWTQWCFELLFERGLAYQKESLQWWCETDKTVLANEQVEAGKCWRCGNAVTKKPLKQWFFKITDYADRLADDLEKLDWSDAIKAMQRNWIGKSKGAEVKFKLEEIEGEVVVFTTRPDTLFGATFMVLAPEHPLTSRILTEETRAEVEAYVAAAAQKSDIERQETNREKTGVFSGRYAINPATGGKIPIWIADYVLAGYGTGAIMAVPAHDERDYEFAKKFTLPIVPVIAREHVDNVRPLVPGKPIEERKAAQIIVQHPTEDKYLMLKLKGWEVDTYSLPIGGVDEGEEPVESVLRELHEETGFTDIGDVTSIAEPYFALFHHDLKQVNRRALVHSFYTRLNSLEQIEVADSELAKHDLLWVDLEELHNKLHGQGVQEIVSIFRDGGRPSTGEGILINSEIYSGLSSSEAREKIVFDLQAQELASEVTNYKIRDWLISRQRYWGAPIPIIHCPEHGAVLVPKDQLPVKLPEVESYLPTGEGTSVLASVDSWVNTTCPQCGGPAKRETDTMDGFACSSWYFLRFADPHNPNEAFSKEKAKYWLPVDDYIGGAEHAVMHLLYARMWTKVMFDAGLIDFDEPFTSLRNHGMILAPDGRKMSKSWGNVIAPDDIIAQGYGADSVRLMELFIGPWNQAANWSVEGMGGVFRFLNRVWTLVGEYIDRPKNQQNPENQADLSEELKYQMHAVIRRVTEDMQSMGFNTALASLMEYVNFLYKIKGQVPFNSLDLIWQETVETLLKLLAPFAPHMTEELWQLLGHRESVHTISWPAASDRYQQKRAVTIAVQVNGKLRGTFDIALEELNEEEIKAAAARVPRVQDHLAGKEVKKIIYVPGKLVSFVVV